MKKSRKLIIIQLAIICLSSFIQIVESFKSTNNYKENKDTYVGQNKNTDDAIFFNLPDLTIQYKPQDSSNQYQLEAFKSSNNDKILNEKDQTKYNQLHWVSIGHPILMKTSMKKEEKAQYFHFSKERIYTKISMLTDEHMKIFAEQVAHKYNVSISPEQIKYLPLSRFECNLELNDDHGRKYILHGEVTNLNQFPFQLDFTVQKNSKHRKVLQDRISEEGNDLDLSLQCKISSSKAKLIKKNSLTITSTQLNQMNLNEKLFGPANYTYVTRDQVNAISSYVHRLMNVLEEYEMDEYTFNEAFIDDFIIQTAAVTFTQVDFDEAIRSLSNFSMNFASDLTGDEIKREASKIFKIVDFNNKSNIVVDKDALSNSKLRNKTGSEYSLAGEGYGFSLSGSIKNAEEREKEWLRSNKDHNQQLAELNTHTTDDVQWTIEGNKIVPKSISVARLSKLFFSKTLTFNRIKKKTFDALFDRSFSIYTREGTIQPSDIELINEKINKVTENFNKLTIEIKNTIDNTKENIEKEINYRFLSNNIILGNYLLKRTLTGHTSYVRALTVLSNGDLVSGSEDKTIKIWNPLDGTLKRTLTGDTLWVNALTVLPNGDLVSGSEDKTIKIWNPLDGTLKRTLTGHTLSVHALTVLPNGDLASGSEDKTIKIWNPLDGTLKRTLTGHTSYVRALTVLSNGDLVSGSEDKTIKIWNPLDGTLKRTLTGHTLSVHALTVLPNGDLASGSEDETIKIWNPLNGTLKRTLTGDTSWVNALTVLPNGDLVSGSVDETIKIWNPLDGTLKRTLTGHTLSVWAFTFLPNGDLVSGSGDQTIKIWNPRI